MQNPEKKQTEVNWYYILNLEILGDFISSVKLTRDIPTNKNHNEPINDQNLVISIIKIEYNHIHVDQNSNGSW